MNIGAVSTGGQYAPLHQALSTTASMTRVKDNDGDYDNGTGADDAVKSKSLQANAQPNLGTKVDMKV